MRRTGSSSSRHTAELLQQLPQQFTATHEPQREFVCWQHQAGSWSAPRGTIVKVEVSSEGTNRRATLTNRPGGAILPGATDSDLGETNMPTVANPKIATKNSNANCTATA